MIRVYSKPYGILRIHEVNTDAIDEAIFTVIEQVYGEKLFNRGFAVLALVPTLENKP